MASVFSIYDRAGALIAEVSGLATYSDKVNKIGQAQFILAKTDATEDLIRFGNYLRIEHDQLGVWGGVIDEPQPWAENSITLTAYTGAHLLKGRYPNSASYTGQAGAIFRALIDDANYTQETGIEYESADVSGATFTEPGDTSIYEIMVRVAQRSGQEWHIYPALGVDGHFAFQARWQESIGVYRDDVLEEGEHFKRLGDSPLMTLQGQIINDLKLRAYYTDGSEVTVTAVDQDSIDTYGRRQAMQTATLPAGMDAAEYATYLLNTSKAPRRTFPLAVINENTNLSRLGLGDEIGIRLMRYGWTDGGLGTEARVRILSREFSAPDGAVSLVVDEVV